MKLALLTEANPRVTTQSHPSFVSKGRYRVTADSAKSKLSVRRRSMDGNIESLYEVGDEFDGQCVIVIHVIEAHPDDKRITVYAERVECLT